MKLANDFAFEIIERIARFRSYLRDVKQGFYHEPYQQRMDDKIGLLAIYENLLYGCFESLLATLSKEKNEDEAIKLLIRINASLKNLHKQLVHLPKPESPKELRRFCRIIEKHVLKGESTTRASIHPTEQLGESTFRGDPLVEYKDTDFNKLREEVAATFDYQYATDIEPDSSVIHIGLPMIDMANPLKWPSILHEVAHHLFSDNHFDHGDIEKEFLSSLSKEQQQYIHDVEDQFVLTSWLIECWCDLFAAVSVGPCLWFSQYFEFLFCDFPKNKTHPPPGFRLKLIYKILNHRFPQTEFVEDAFIEGEMLLSAVIEESELPEFDVDQLQLLFRDYFLNHFFFEGEGEKLNQHLGPLIVYTQGLDADQIEQLVGRLSQGKPIPSNVIPETKGTISNRVERPTSVQEILLAAWIHRNKEVKGRVQKEISATIAQLDNVSSDEIRVALDKIASELNALDTAVLRSIQVSEWFDVLRREPNREFTMNTSYGLTSSGFLSDSEIFSLISHSVLEVIPLIDLDEQLSSSSLDIRLGTSFQIFPPNQHEVLDMVVSDPQRDYGSTIVDLDLFESITIFPGQFLLSHSMEYFSFPPYISGLLEGRSGFAREGIQVHPAAGFIDPGFEGVLTFEICNIGGSPIKLYPGIRIAQIRFTRMDVPTRSYRDRHQPKYSGLLTLGHSRMGVDREVEILRRQRGENK